MTSRVTGVVLAAGAASRMGTPKQLLPLAGKPLLAHVLDAALASRLDDVIVVLGEAAAEIREAVDFSSPRVRVVENPRYLEGQATSLQAALDAAPAASDALAVLVGDQPGVTPALIDALLAFAETRVEPIIRPAFAGAAGRVPGHPVILRREAWPAIRTLEGDEAARRIIRDNPGWVAELQLDTPPPPDIDTPADYAAAAAEATGS